MSDQPLSVAQERLWFIAQFDPGNPVFHLAEALRLTGPLDRPALEQALNAVVRRHDVLRTSFAFRDGRPVPVVAPVLRLRLHEQDLSELRATEREAELRRLAVAGARRPFEFERAPLLRAGLLRLGESEHVLLLSFHQLVADASSLGMFHRELAALYQGLSTGDTTPLSELPIRYADFAQRQRQWLQGEESAAQLAFWMRELKGAPPAVDLPLDHPRGALPSYRGARRALNLSPGLSDDLKALSRRQEVSPFTLLLAAFKVLLGRTTLQEDIVVGTEVANRGGDTERLFGRCANLLALRSDLRGGPTYQQLLARVATVTRTAWEHRDLPFEALVEELQPQRDMSHQPLFQVTFGYRESPPPVPELSGLSVRRLEIDDQTARFDLALEVEGRGRAWRVALEYDADLFDAATILRMLDHYRILLAAVVTDPAVRIGELVLVGAGERHQLLAEWNDTASAYPDGTSLQELFELRAHRTPDTPALLFGDAPLSYGELNRRANRLAHYLRQLGVGSETPVATRLERSPELVVALLAIIKAGGCYVPLDLDYPLERVTFMLADSAAAVLLTSGDLAEGLPTGATRVISLDTDAEAISRHPAEDPPSRSSGGQLAYVIYTSGSTGRPKGVAVPQQAVSRLVLGSDYVQLTPRDRVAQASNASFDAATFEIWGALLNGACLVGISKEVALSPPDLAQRLRAQGVTALFVTTALFNQIARQAPEVFTTVRHVLFGGEAVDPGAVREVLADARPERLLHVYGPTESTTFTTWHRVTEVPPEALTVAIGRAIANTTIHVLEPSGLPAPAGVAGELVIAGDGLARGYLGQPALTAEKFVPDPFADEPGGRLYRSGDLVRRRPSDGAVEFLGRLDHQVKIRGFRIELGEIEALLGEHSAVRESVVMVREDGPVSRGPDAPGARDRRLVAYVVREPGWQHAQDSDWRMADELRRFLGEKLPDYMVPAACVFLDALPLTPNGKVDRRALPAPELERPESEEAFVAPRTPLEEQLATIWGEVLGVERIGADDDFFTLGGHSLLATQVQSRMRRQLGVELPLRIFFAQPTVAELAGWVTARWRGEEGIEAPPLRPAAREGHPPLSFAQQRLWFIDRFEPNSALYNVPANLHLRGHLDPDALARALGEIVRRQEVLRTSFEIEEDGPHAGDPVQVIHPPFDGARSDNGPGAAPSQRLRPTAASERPVLELALPVRDLTGLREAERWDEARRLALAEAHRPFDLVRGPVLRTALLRLSAQQHLLLLTVHHIAFDGWSVGVFLRELRALYQAFAAGVAVSPLPELPVQYADFAVWQRRWLTGEILEKQLAYWREQLAGLPVLELPTDRPRPAVQSFRGAEEVFRLPAESAGCLSEISRQQGGTLFMTLLAAFQLLLGRYAGQEDLAVASAIANRNQGEIEGLVGFFVNTLVLRADLSGGPTYRELLARLRDVTLGAYVHQDLPFEKLVEELAPERHLSHSPLVQVIFALQNAPMLIPELAPGLRVELEFVAVENAKFDLTVSLEEGEDGLVGTFGYNTDLFDRTTLRRLVGHFATLLQGIAGDPGQRLSELRLLAPAERHELLYEWNDASSDYPAEISIARLFELQVERRPEAVALVLGDELLSYRELNRRANRLAHHLLALGVDRGDGPSEVMTGIYMDRSLRTLVAILAILKAGGVYLPLDLSYPPERLAFMLEDAGAPVLISEQKQAATLPPDLAGRGVTLVCLDRDEAAIAEASDRNPEASAAVTGDHLAYVIYTSGSTGIPKGVAVSHRAVARLVFNTNYIALKADDRVAQASTTSFDAATFELWGALVHGGRLVGISKEVALAPQAFAAALREHRITVLFLTTALFNQMVSEDPAVFNSLRHLLFGGEAVDPHWVREALASGGPQRLLHVYGPTESTTYATWHRVREVTPGARTVPIGGPLANTEIYVLDRSLEPVPAGVAGELLIAGDGLARGYLKRPGLTADRFIPNPFVGNPTADRGIGTRLYRTGDLVRLLPEGAVEFLGRLDFQVKIRGFRIELGEVEAVLGHHPAVREAFVVAERTESGDQYLVAYVVPEGEAVAADQLREFLLRTLPEYMVPSALVSLEALPLGPTGKVDRTALPAPERVLEPTAHFVAPRGPVEEALVGIWAEVLGEGQTRPQVGVHDDFFALGGHSLLAARVVSRIRTTLGVELPLVKLFEAPTVAGLAARAGELMRAEGARPAPPIERVPRAGDLQLSFAQERLWFLDRYQPDSPVYNIPVAYELIGGLSPAALAASLSAVVERHEALRTTIGEGPRQVIAAELEVNLPLVDLRGLPAGVRPAAATELAETEARRPFDLAAGPLLRVTLLRLEEEQHRLLVTLHHIISDGWSMEVLESELAAFYQLFTTAEPARGAPTLPELPIQYPDFAAWQRRWLTGAVIEEQLAYWRETLAGAATALELPFDRPRPPVQTYRGAAVSRPFPAALSEPLEDLGRRRGTTLFMTLMAAFFTLLHRYAGQRDLLVGTPVASRGRREVEGLIGFFVNTLVLRCDLGAEPTWRELLGRVREAALGAYAHQDLPFERLVEELRPERDLSRTPIFQVMFGVHRARRRELAPGLPMPRVNVEHRSAKFDLSLYFFEEGSELVAWVGYSTDLFDGVTIERLLAHLERLLGAIVEDPERSVSELPLLTPGEEQALLLEWNDTAIDDAVGGCVHELFAQQAARRPAAVAVTHGERVLTYGELGRRADRLAQQLRRRGVGPDEVVALFVERSPEMLVGMLGVLAAGGAYLPLDPAYPASRLSYMLADAGTWVILTQEGLRDRLEDALPEPAPEVMVLDPSPRPSPLGRGLRKHLPSSPRGEGAPTHPKEAPTHPNRSGPENLAYVIYTSGSTGRPKGVEIRHSGLVNLVRWHQRTYRVTADDRATQVAGLSFDASVREIWPYLTAGASLHLPDQETRLSPTRLVAWLTRKAVTLGFQPTPLAEALLAEPWPAGTPLRALLTGGDRLHKRPGNDFRCALCNHYGPTENTVVTTAGAVRPQAPRLPTIGRPIANTAVYVVDRRLRPVPVGVAGELVTRGAGLARGYTRRPALSAERFIPDPWSPEEGGRLYRTGDLVRWGDDGRVEFLGRIDHQVKIRGYRIELGEIEEVLGEHSGVAEAVVMPRWERLVAWVVPADDAALTGAELRRFLAERLPDYMVPGVFSLLEELPLLPSGKVDRAALPEPAAREEPESSVAPRGPVEEILAGIWSEVLGCDRVGIHDDFFELGGHSLLAARVVSRANAALGVEIALRQLFDKSTVAGLAVEIEKLSATDRGVPREPLQPVPRTGPLPLSFAQERLWFLYQLEPESTAYNSVNALNFKGSLLPDALRRAFDEIVRRHEVLRTTFAVVDDRPVQRISPPGEHPLLLVDLARLPERDLRAELGARFRQDTARPFDLTRGPLFRSTLVRLAGDDHVLLLAKHHIIFDGWSAGVVVRELATLYRTFAAGPQAPTAPSPLEPLPIQYADFACWQRRHLRGEVLEQQLAFWRARLESPRPVARLATDHPRDPAGRSRAAGRRFRFSAATSNALCRLSRRQGATLFMTLAAAFQTLLHRHTGAPVVVLGAPIANRNHHEIEGLIGFFVNILVMRSDFSDDPTFRQLLERVREETLEAYAHQDLPFEKLVEALQPGRSADPQALVQTLFAFQNVPSGILELPGVALHPLEVEDGATQNALSDLSVAMGETDEFLEGGAQYDAALFEAATIEALLDHFRLLLEEIAADPDRRVGDYALLSETERRRILDVRSRIDPEDPLWSEIRERLGSDAPERETAVRVYLLDRKQRPVPVAGVGEIYLEGMATAAEVPSPAVAAAWRPHPFTGEPGSRLYASGVPGRRRADGRLELRDAVTREQDRAREVERPTAGADALAAEAAAVDQRRAKLSSRQDRLSETRRALLARRLRGRSKTAPAADAIPRRSGRGPVPLSFAQQRLWFFDQFEPGTALYNIPLAMRLSGRIDLAVLARSLNEILRRHEGLRMTVGNLESGPAQVIASALRLELPMVDLGWLPPSAREAESQRLADAEADRPFELCRGGPLVRASVLRLAGTPDRADAPDREDHVILVTMHHIISDGWSTGVFIRELVTLYGAFSQASPGPNFGLPELPIQYPDYAVWQRQWLRGEVLEKLLGYWRERLSGAPPRLELFTDRPRPVVQSFRGRWRPIVLSRQLSESLARLSQQEGATMFMILLAGFTALLARYTGRQDLVVGTPVAGRNRRELEDLIGFFVNVLVLRIDFRNPSFRQLLVRARQVTLDAHAHQEIPFERLVEELEPERDLSSTPLFQVMFSVENAPEDKFEAPGLTLSPVPRKGGETAKFDLTLGLQEGDDGVRGAVEYSSDLFDDSTMERLLAHFKRLVAGCVEDPDRRLSELPWWTAADRQQLLVEWNDTSSDYPRDSTIARLFERQVERTPEAVAVVFGDPPAQQCLSYGELNRRANRLAHHLRLLGVGPEVLTGIYLERSLRTIEGILGILKAGGAYLPLDLSYPRERLAFMLEDAGAPVLVTEEELAATLPPEIAERGLEVVCLDRDAAAIVGAGDRNPEPAPAVSGNHLAYVIYTSGSTGIPKGVAVDHRAVARLVIHTNYIALDPGDRVAQASTTSFDAATFELWGALLHGGCLVGISKQVALEPERFAAVLLERRITTLFLTTALFNQMVREAPEAFSTLRHLLFGGEAVDPHQVRETLASGGFSGRLLHVYGPTESTTYATWQRVREVAEGARTVPIGGPLANTELYVLDRSPAPVPVGVAGELLIAGDGLARGYLNRPALTAERFIPDPFAGVRGGRLYRTGDLVRYLPDGAVEFLGRLDFQVKLRGFRVELGEIEALLARHPGVREAVVVVTAPERRLVAYVVPAQEAAPLDAVELRAQLAQSLPDYMVPSALVSLDALPLTPTGKVDRRALPAPDRSAQAETFVAPSTPTEETLAGIWAEVLGLEGGGSFTGRSWTQKLTGSGSGAVVRSQSIERGVSVTDNFFEIGGHSLLATQLMAGVRHAFQVELPLSALFEGPTVRRLAAIVDQRGAGSSPLVAIRREGSLRPLFCVHPSGGNVLCFRELAEALGDDRPIYALQARGFLAGEEPRRRIEEMAAAYIEAMRVVEPEGPYLLLGYSLGGLVVWEMARQFLAAGREVDLVAILDVPARIPEDSAYFRAGDAALLLAELEGAISLSPAELEGLEPEEQLAAILREGKAAGGLRSEFGIDDLRRYLELLKAHREAVGAYSPQPYPGRVALFRAMDGLSERESEDALGWRALVQGELELHRVPGRHLTMMQSPHVRVLAEQLSKLLADL